MRRRVLLVLAVAVPLAVVDLVHKAVVPTPLWAYHPRGAAWLVLSASILAGCLALARVPSRAVAVFAGLLAAGAVGNGVAALVWDAGIPNPLVVRGGSYIAAFNLADVVTLAGIGGLMVTLVAVTLGNRAALRPPHELARLFLARRR